jgi:CrcB protein
MDPDVADRRRPTRRARLWRGQGLIIGAVALGGGAGAAGRYGMSLIWPTAPGAFPWTTLAVNAAGCALIGVLMVVISDVWAAHRLVRPFLGTGVLGGFTTFSAYAADVYHLVDEHQARTALAYLGATLMAALGAVWIAVSVTRRVLAWRAR